MLGRSRGPIKSPFAAMKSPLWTTLPSWSVYVPIVSTTYGCASDTGIVFGRTDWPYSFRTVTASRPSASLSPRFVKIWITPFAASEPYSDDAAAPFTSSTRSMSCELMSASPCRVMVPSTMTSGPDTLVDGQGWLVQADLLVSAVAERRRMIGSPPGAPLASISRTPATLPSSDPRADTAGASWSWERSTWLTANGTFLSSVPPAVPVTMTTRSEEHTSELQSHSDLVCRLLLEKKNKQNSSTRPRADTAE